MVSISINGKAEEIDVDPAMPILWVVREKLAMTGTKFGCGIAQCGACTVHLDGQPIRSCSTPISAAEGKAITTIDGVRTGLHGFCPVSLAQTAKWVSGTKDIQHEFDGVHYRFVSEEQRDLFKADPEKFVPALRGYDPVSITRDQTVRTGMLSLGARYQGQLFFFSSEENRDEFLITPSDYANAYRLTFFKSAAAQDSSSADKG